MTVDASGSTVTSNPTYYQLVYLGGQADRFYANTNAPSFGRLHSVVLPEGRELTYSNSSQEVIWDANDVIRQVLAPQAFAPRGHVSTFAISRLSPLL